MPHPVEPAQRDNSSGLFRRGFFYQFAFCHWTRELPKSKRLITRVGLFIGYAIYAAGLPGHGFGL